MSVHAECSLAKRCGRIILAMARLRNDSLLFREGDEGIDPRSAPGGHGARGQPDERQNHSDRRDDGGLHRLHAIKLRRQRAAQRERAGEPKRETGAE